MNEQYQKRLAEIRRGRYTFNEVGDINVKNEMASILVKEYEDGSITDEALKSLINHYKDQIKIFKRITIDDIPEPVRNLVAEII